MKLKRLISVVLAVLMLCSIMVVAVEAKDTNTLKTGAKRPLIQDVVNSDAKNQVDTNTYLFYFPDSWRNEHNNYYSGTLDTCKPGIYWWDGSYRCDDYKGENTNGFPGYAVNENVDNNKNIYKAEVPADVENIMWNNLVEVDPANQETYQYLIQTDNIVSSFYNTEEDIYGFYPEGLSSFDNMIYVVDPQSEKTQGYGTTLFRGEWFYYYGNSEYGIYPTRNEAEANNAVYSNGEFPKYEGEEEGTNPGTEATEQQGGSYTYSVLFENKQKWENVYVYAWESNGAEENAAWPGEKLAVWEITSDDIEIYKATIPKKFDMFVFSDGTAAESTVEIKYNPEVIGYYPKERDSREKWEVGTYPEIEPTEPTEYVNPDDTKIYFDTAGWKVFSKVFCYIWERNGEEFFPWHSKNTQCNDEGNGIFSFDTEKLKESFNISGGLKPDKDYLVIFSNEKQNQIYECTLGLACLGDTLKIIESEKLESPVDYQKTLDKALWEKNSGTYGPHLILSSIGNIVGQFFCPNETGIEVIGDWLPTYYKSQYVKPVEALVNAFPRFGIKTYDDITAIYNYIVAKHTGEDEAEMKRMLDEAYRKMPKEQPTSPAFKPTQPFTKPKNRAATTEKKTDNPIKVTVKAKTVKLKKLKKKAQKVKAITVKGAEGKVTFKVVKSGITKKIRKLVKINSKGVITIKKWKKAKKGTYKIKVTVKAAGNSSYNAKTITKTIKVKIK